MGKEKIKEEIKKKRKEIIVLIILINMTNNYPFVFHVYILSHVLIGKQVYEVDWWNLETYPLLFYFFYFLKHENLKRVAEIWEHGLFILLNM